MRKVKVSSHRELGENAQSVKFFQPSPDDMTNFFQERHKKLFFPLSAFLSKNKYFQFHFFNIE
jgi:hypothetical protein